MKKLFVTALTSLLAIGSLLVPTSAFAAAGSGTASLHFSPASGSYTVGQTVTLTITETSSTAVAAVEADMTYPSNLLQCNGPASLGAFATSYQNVCAGGSLSLAVGVQGTPVTGTQTVGTVSFTVIASGTAALKVAGTSEIDDAAVANVCDSTCASGATVANYSLAAASQPVAVQNTSTTTSTPKTATTSTTTSAPTTQTQTPTTTTATTSKSSKTTTYTPQPRHIRSHHTGIVTSTLSALVIVIAAVYWLVIRKRTEVAPVKAYKLNSASKTKSTTKKKTTARNTATAKRKPVAKKTK
jgi:hypothetical protein